MNRQEEDINLNDYLRISHYFVTRYENISRAVYEPHFTLSPESYTHHTHHHQIRQPSQLVKGDTSASESVIWLLSRGA
jgi:hypothetical protein